MTFENCRKA